MKAKTAPAKGGRARGKTTGAETGGNPQEVSPCLSNIVIGKKVLLGRKEAFVG